MSQRNVYGGGVKQQVEQGAHRAVKNPAFERLARLGYGAKGVVYLVGGALSTRAAFGLGGTTTDSRGALQAILSEPLTGLLQLPRISSALAGGGCDVARATRSARCSAIMIVASHARPIMQPTSTSLGQCDPSARRAVPTRAVQTIQIPIANKRSSQLHDARAHR